MKHIFYTLMIVTGITVFTSCSEDKAVPEFNQRIQNGTWKVTGANYQERIDAGLFDKYTISFTTQNTVVASGVNFYKGWWEMREENGPVLEIKFNTPYEVPMVYLNGTWRLTDYNDQTIHMTGTGTPNEVTLEKM